MSEPLSHPPAKKGLSPIAWVAIGCGALILVGGIVIAGVVGFAGYKAKEYVKGMEDQPVTTMAKVIAFANPEIELVEADEEGQRATFRNIETGETFTVDGEDLENGRISFESDGEKVTFDGQAEADGGGSVTVSGAHGTTVYKGGAGSASDVPAWVPTYPGGAVEGAYSAQSDAGQQGAFSVTTGDSMDEVIEYYRDALEEAGYTIESTSFDSPGLRQQSLAGRKPGEERQITVIVRAGEQSGSEGTTAMVQYSG